ncbi:2-(1,2-epoxy-1,2-dihydrophenyl)acetyl-CoA isomerase [Bacillus lacus]|uniref:2-(1,2-epoxy-1,2-dihydrophenyl)acetyl-CoA isomerase n=1 Tax=Metabacillus lacus TaxID=1983721 RepID=A0A7X2IXX4_9BACI|nr:enoyl-CoA hydratase-related protein [Metabacillus lacus]MRX71852.1 2-(1,2-epoxy-1,2-dihydrophenyl)acetyl-CoA isomerase [Metabacillus lacus]
MYETVLYEVRNATAYITLNRPETYNAFTEQLNKDLGSAVKAASRDDSVRVLVVTGAGKAFCSGEDLGGVSENMDHGEVLRSRYNPMLLEIERCEKPIVAAVNGVAAGAGMSLALSCDFRVASEKASFVEAFIHVGLVPDAGNLYFLPRIIGHAKALELAVFGEKVSAEKALNVGLVTEVYSHESWEEDVSLFADRLAKLPTKAVGLIKRNLRASWSSTYQEFLERDAQAQRIAGKTDDHREGVQSFIEKRKPLFTGK